MASYPACTRMRWHRQRSNLPDNYGFPCSWLRAPYSLAFLKYPVRFPRATPSQCRSQWCVGSHRPQWRGSPVLCRGGLYSFRGYTLNLTTNMQRRIELIPRRICAERTGGTSSLHPKDSPWSNIGSLGLRKRSAYWRCAGSLDWPRSSVRSWLTWRTVLWWF